MSGSDWQSTWKPSQSFWKLWSWLKISVWAFHDLSITQTHHHHPQDAAVILYPWSAAIDYQRLTVVCTEESFLLLQGTMGLSLPSLQKGWWTHKCHLCSILQRCEWREMWLYVNQIETLPGCGCEIIPPCAHMQDIQVTLNTHTEWVRGGLGERRSYHISHFFQEKHSEPKDKLTYSKL